MSPAMAAGRGERTGVPAVMADQAVHFFMIGQAHGTMIAANHLGAGSAIDQRGVASPVQEDNGLLPVGQTFVQGLPATGAERSVCLGLLQQIDQLDIRKGPAADACGHGQEPHLAALSGKKGLHIRSGRA